MKQICHRCSAPRLYSAQITPMHLMQNIFQLLDGNCEIDQTGRTSRHSGFQALGELTRMGMAHPMVPTEVQFAPTTDVAQTLHIPHAEHDPPFPPGTCGTPPHLVSSIVLSRAYDRNFSQNDQLSLHRGESPLQATTQAHNLSSPYPVLNPSLKSFV